MMITMMWTTTMIVLLGSVVVRALDLQSTGRGFDSRPLHCRVATLGKSFTLTVLATARVSIHSELLQRL